MVMPTPFERLLKEASQQASQDPAAAFSRLDELYGKTLSEQDVLQLGAFSVHLGGAALKRYEETMQFQRRLLQHPALTANGPVMRSLWRGLAVVLTCLGRKDDVETALGNGISSPAERCRFLVLCAQTLAAAGRVQESVPLLTEARTVCAEVPADDEILPQASAICVNLARLADVQLRQFQSLLVASCQVVTATWERQSDWRSRHMALYQLGTAWLLSASPARTLGIVQEMMELEDVNDAGPEARFYTASLACRAQAVRGQFKIVAAALEACQDFARRVPDNARKQIDAAVQELEQYVAGMRI